MASATLDEYVLKIPLVGSHDTGKTTLVQRICNPTTSSSSSAAAIGDTKPTVGVEFSSRVIKNLRPNTLVRLQLWDTAGTERYAAVAAPVYRNAGGIIAVCDVTNADSLTDLIHKWLPRVFEHLPTLPMTSILVICNKCDLVGVGHHSAANRKRGGGGGGRGGGDDEDDATDDGHVVAAFTPVEAVEALEAAGIKGALVMEGSAMTGANVESAIGLLCNRVISKFADIDAARLAAAAAAPPASAGAAMPKGANGTAKADGRASAAGKEKGAKADKAKDEGTRKSADSDDDKESEGGIPMGWGRSASTATLPPDAAAAANAVNKVDLGSEGSKKGDDGKSKCPC